MDDLQMLESIGSCLVSLSLWVGWMFCRDRVREESAITEVQEVADPSGRGRPCYLVHMMGRRKPWRPVGLITVHVTGAQAWYVSDGVTHPDAVALARRARMWLDGSDDVAAKRKKLSQDALDEVIHGDD